MNDPWDVKSRRLGHQYSSCMKINGVPLLPPVLSAECRKEMQYYKLLAKEVEARISLLRPFIEFDSESLYDITDAPDTTDGEYTPVEEKVEDPIDFILEKFSSNVEKDNKSSSHSPTPLKYKSKHSNLQDTQIVIDLNLQFADDREVYSSVHRSPQHSPEPDEIPERDCDYKKKNKKQKELITNLKTDNKPKEELIIDIINHTLNTISSRDTLPLHQDGPSSLSSKSFTGSLNDIHAEVFKQSQGPKLIRQSSYTVLNPSPQLLAHLEVESFNTGVELNSISMSESMTKLSQSAKKRKSWDLESAKVKWSSMAMELKTKNIVTKSNGANNNAAAKNVVRKPSHTSPMGKSNSLSHDRRGKDGPGRATKSENGQKPKTIYANKGRSLFKENPSPTNASAINVTPKSASTKKEENSVKTVPLVSESDDPAVRVKELYEKLQKQQLMQMASLMEKQKREQQLLQQVFEEQNNILFKQLKTVCPKASIEVKQAWGDLKDDNDRGPVSLSQLINTSTPENSISNSPVSKTLNESSSCISKCDSMLKKSRDITNSLKKQTSKPRTTNGVHQKAIDQVPATPSQEISVKRVSPTRNTSRKLNYDTSSDVDPMLTDRTNDTMADLNVTFPSDISDSVSHSKSIPMRNKAKISRACSPLSPRHRDPNRTCNRTEGAIKNLEDNIQTSINSTSSRSVMKQSILYHQPNAKELVAATKIVACAKGYLVRRLMRTERVQATVQTIRDALLCALQLHQDREGIRGADVDLHRRLIQQITAACYTLHDTFVTSTATERCAVIAADRARRQALATKQPTPKQSRRDTITKENIMSQSHSGAFPSRANRPTSGSLMTQSNYETFSNEKSRSRFLPGPRKAPVPWRC